MTVPRRPKGFNKAAWERLQALEAAQRAQDERELTREQEALDRFMRNNHTAAGL